MTKQGVFNACTAKKDLIWFPRDIEESHLFSSDIENNNKSAETVSCLWINTCSSGTCAVRWQYYSGTLCVDRVPSPAFKLQLNSDR